MFNFLFRRKNGKIEAKTETQRETITRALDEVNALIALIDPKPAITIEPATGQITLALPEQMPDEALALPSPQAEDAAPVEPKAEEPAPEKAPA